VENKFDSFEFFAFAKRYIGFLAVVVSIPLVSQIIRALPVLNENTGLREVSVLSLLSSLLCLLTFGAGFTLKGVIYKAQKSKWLFLRFLPFILIFSSCLLGIYLVSVHLENYNLSGEVYLKSYIYLLIYPTFVFGLSVLLVSTYNLEEAFKIQNIITSELGAESDEITRLLLSYAKYKKKAGDSPAFMKIGQEVLNTSNGYISNLGEGVIEVSGRLTPDIQRILASRYLGSFHAVSYRDIDFWANTDSETVANQYLQLNIDSFNKGVGISRLFIFNKEDLKVSFRSIVDIIKRQNSLGFGFAIMIEEEMDYPSGFLKSGNLDFALFDKEKVITYFRSYRENKRQFRAVFNVDDDNRKEINGQTEVYKSILSKCWIMNQKFIENNNDFFCEKLSNSKTGITVGQACTRSSNNLIASLKDFFHEKSEELLGECGISDRIDEASLPTVPRPLYLVKGGSEVEEKLREYSKLIELVNKWSDHNYTLNNEK